ncbi:Endonuclease/exonuclease/phosphatase superfamily [Sesbania bispinosa]|nr:Endonuclease/exonuclease/phosphatase superfamily [Sesbania bispinosa]
MTSMVFSAQREVNPTPPKPPDGGEGSDGGGIQIGGHRARKEPATSNPFVCAVNNFGKEGNSDLENQNNISPHYGDWIIVSRNKKNKKEKNPSQIKGKVGREQPEKVSNKFQHPREEGKQDSLSDMAAKKGKAIVGSDSVTPDPKVWVCKRPRKDTNGTTSMSKSVGPNSIKSTNDTNANSHAIKALSQPVPDTHIGVKQAASLYTWKDRTKTAMPLLRVANNRFTFLDQDTHASDNAMEVCAEEDIHPKEPPDLTNVDNENNSIGVESFQDCEKVLMDCFKDTSILAWNIRGARSSRGKRYLKQLLSGYNPTICFMFETHCLFSVEERFWNRLGYDMCGLIEAQKPLGWGINGWTGSAVYASPIPTRREALWDHLRSLRPTVTSPWMLMGDFNEITRSEEVRGACYRFSTYR